MKISCCRFYRLVQTPVFTIIFMALFTMLSKPTMAQQRGTLTIEKDPRIDSLLALRVTLSKMPRPANTPTTATPSTTATQAGTASGFRVQFFMGSNRNEVYDAQSKFNLLYPQYRTYIVYNAPNFKVRAGDFRTRLEATRFMQQLKGQFTGLFIIADKINLQKASSQ